MTQETQQQEVLIIYCKCGKNLISVGNPDTFSSKEVASAIKEKRKIKVISFDKYKKMDAKLYCPNFVEEKDCPNNIKSK